jgi:predicted nucleic acid-binding protein
MAIVLADTNLWLRSVDPGAAQHDVAKRARAALMKAHDVKHLLTFNDADFTSFPDVIVLDPAKVAAGKIIVA